MTDEQRLDRLERIVKLMVKAGLRARRQSREQDEKINILISMHMENEERFRQDEERLRKNEEAIAELSVKTDERFAALATQIKAMGVKTDESLAAMAAAEARTDERLKSFMETVERIIQERRNGQP